MRRSEYLALTRRLITHLENGTTDSAENVKYVPVGHYLDPARWQREMDRIFKRLPLLLAFSCEMRAAGDYKAMDVVGVPVLIARAKDGVARAFVNVCSHRGTVIANDGKGNCTRFVCPYHGWTYSDRGELVGVAGRRKFGEVDTVARGLTELPCAERAGLIFVSLEPGTSINLEAYLGGMLPELESFGFENWHMFKQNELATSNWKVAHDGYLEGYHFSTLHPQTVGAQVISNIMAYDAYGPHQRVAFPEHRIKALMSKSSEEWKTEDGIAVVRTIFPNVSFAVSSQGGGMVSQLMPGPTPDKSRTIQNHLFPGPPASDAERARMEATTRFFTGAVEHEDNWVCARIQRGLTGGGNKDFVFGKNELGLHRLHDWIEHFVNLPSDATDGARLRVVGSASKQSTESLR
jgi:phenylpropionate dioxygenase-like ring-hydroxylating dioxygenase large terminal subunit